MAKGDTNDVLGRLRGALPPWFPDAANAPILTAILSGIADGFAFIHDYLRFARLQTRIASATDGWLDLIAWDFFAGRFVRRQGETDAVWRPRILKEILRPRQTRVAISTMLTDLTTKTPKIIELWNPQDCGGYGVPQMGGYGTGPGCYGSLLYPNQILVTAYRAPTQGIPNADGYGGYAGGYGVGSIEYGSLAFISGPITDAEIYARIQQTIAAGITAWVALQNGPGASTSSPSLDFSQPGNSQYLPLL